MVNYRMIAKIIGQLLLLESLLMFVCLGVAVGYGEDDVLAFLLYATITSSVDVSYTHLTLPTISSV